jgi:rubrerythrin
MKKNNYIEFRRYSDFQFNAILLDVVQKYFRLKKSCEIAKKILKENCHDFYFPLDMSEINNSYCEVMNVAAERNIPVNYSISDFECSVEEVAQVLNTMCGLELSWLDENRVIFDKDAFYIEEENTLEFYKNLISNLTDEQISSFGSVIDDVYMLSL